VSSKNDKYCVYAGICDSNLMYECIAAQCMVDVGEHKVVSVVVVGSDKLIRLIKGRGGCRDTGCTLQQHIDHIV
jgi:hypothetical protein